MKDNGNHAVQTALDGPRVLSMTFAETPEVSERVSVVTPDGALTATWLGVVGTGPGAMSLAEAMRLMAELEREREALAAMIA